MKRLVLSAIGLMASAGVLGGCVTSYTLVAASTPGKVWAFGRTGPTQAVYLCDATSGKPVCTEQKEQ